VVGPRGGATWWGHVVGPLGGAKCWVHWGGGMRERSAPSVPSVPNLPSAPRPSSKALNRYLYLYLCLYIYIYTYIHIYLSKAISSHHYHPYFGGALNTPLAQNIDITRPRSLVVTRKPGRASNLVHLLHTHVRAHCRHRLCAQPENAYNMSWGPRG
jgi:hypothetical protein